MAVKLDEARIRLLKTNGTTTIAGGHVYLTGSSAGSSTGNTTQIVFGTSSNNHVVLSSNDNALVINPTTSSTTNQIVLYLNQKSKFPSGIDAGTGGITTAGAISATGNISGNYIQGTWLYTSAATAQTTTSKIAVIHSDGYIYYITPANLTTLIKDNASGTWAISISGNAATASSVAWGNVTGKPSTFTPSSHTHSYITSKGNYTFDSSTLPNSFDLGLSCGFVNSDSGFGSYGGVITHRAYSGGGGSLQLYSPYSSNYGGTHLKARFGNYSVSSGNSWTDLKEIAWVSDIPTKISQLTNDASGTWGISISGSAAKLGTSTVGAADRPIYLNSGAATQTTYRMAATNATATTALAITSDLPTGIWYVSGTSGILNQADGVVIANQYNSSWITEIYQDYITGQLAVRGKNNGTWQSWRKVLDDNNYTSYTVTKTGSGASGNWGINITGSSGSCTGNAATATAFSSAASISLSGDVTGSASSTKGWSITTTANKISYPAQLTTDDAINNFNTANKFQVATWNNTSSPGVSNGIIMSGGWVGRSYGWQIAIDDDPTWYIALRQRDGNGWKAWKRIPMGDGTGASGNWGISISGNAATATALTSNAGSTSMPVYFTGGKPSAITALGTTSTPIDNIWAKNIYITNTSYPAFYLIAETANSGSTYSKGMFEVNYTDSIGMWIHSDKTTDTKSRRALVLYGYKQKTNASQAIALRQCDTSGNWQSDLYILHSGNYSSYALPLSGGSISGNVSFSAAASGTSPTAQRISINGISNDSTVANAPGIGFHIGGLNWGSLKFQSDGSFRFYNNDCTAYKPIYGDKVYGAVWNDYAEYRWVLNHPDTDEPIESGRCVAENGNDSMSLTHDRLQAGARIISDTYGMCMGETEKAKTPIAVCGRVLAYPFERKVAFNVGDPVCSGPNGTVSKMSREEAMMYPERIIGTVVSKPTYKEWGPNKIPVKGRIWIQVR